MASEAGTVHTGVSRVAGASRVATVLSYFVLFIAGVFLLVGNLALWLQTTVVDSEEFTQTTTAVLEEPEVQQRISQVLAARVVQSTDLPDRVSAQLPTELAFLGPVLDAQIEDLVARLAARILASDAGEEVLTRVIQGFHENVMGVLRDDDRLLQTQGNQLVLDLRVILERVFERLQVQRPEALDRPDAGRVVVLDDTTGLAGASFLVENIEEITLVCLVLAALLLIVPVILRFGAASLMSAGVVIALTGLITLLIIFATNQLLESLAEELVVTRALIRALEENLRLQSILLLVLGACVFVIGNARLQTRLRAFEDGAAGRVKVFGTVEVLLIAAACAAIVLLLV
jgi:hypothetical protein